MMQQQHLERSQGNDSRFASLPHQQLSQQQLQQSHLQASTQIEGMSNLHGICHDTSSIGGDVGGRADSFRLQQLPETNNEIMMMMITQHQQQQLQQQQQQQVQRRISQGFMKDFHSHGSSGVSGGPIPTLVPGSGGLPSRTANEMSFGPDIDPFVATTKSCIDIDGNMSFQGHSNGNNSNLLSLQPPGSNGSNANSRCNVMGSLSSYNSKYESYNNISSNNSNVQQLSSSGVSTGSNGLTGVYDMTAPVTMTSLVGESQQSHQLSSLSSWNNNNALWQAQMQFSDRNIKTAENVSLGPQGTATTTIAAFNSNCNNNTVYNNNNCHRSQSQEKQLPFLNGTNGEVYLETFGGPPGGDSKDFRQKHQEQNDVATLLQQLQQQPKNQQQEQNSISIEQLRRQKQNHTANDTCFLQDQQHQNSSSVDNNFGESASKTAGMMMMNLPLHRQSQQQYIQPQNVLGQMIGVEAGLFPSSMAGGMQGGYAGVSNLLNIADNRLDGEFLQTKPFNEMSTQHRQHGLCQQPNNLFHISQGALKSPTTPTAGDTCDIHNLRRSINKIDAQVYSLTNTLSSSPHYRDSKDDPIPNARPRNKRVKTFPEKLMEAVDEYCNHIATSADYTTEAAVTWLPDGKSFVIINADLFVDKILNKVFKQAKYASFIRKLHRWGFVRLASGPGTDCFHHPLFNRNQKELASKISCNAINMPPGIILSPSKAAENVDGHGEII